PARLGLGLVGANVLAAAQISNAAMLIAACWFVLLAPWLDPRLARWWSALTLIGPPAWYCVWPHPEVFCLSLVTAGLVCALGRRFALATAAIALASTQNAPLAIIAALAAVLAILDAGADRRRLGLALASFTPALIA